MEDGDDIFLVAINEKQERATRLNLREAVSTDYS
jgi:hypothetical protein